MTTINVDSRGKLSDKMAEYKEDCMFFFVFGCPAAGKGTICRQMADDPAFKNLNLYHLSVGDYLRGRRSDGKLPKDVAAALAEQKLIKPAALLPLLEEKMAREYENTGARSFILDGFPRNSEQMEAFISKYRNKVPLAIFIDATRAIARNRFMSRSDPMRVRENSSLFDMRYAEFQHNNPQLIMLYEGEGYLLTVDNSDDSDSGAGNVYEALNKQLIQHEVAGKMFNT